MKKKLQVIIHFFLVFSFSACIKEISLHKLSINSNPTNGGTVSPDAGFFDKGQQIQIIATPSPTFLFKEWQGSHTGNDNPSKLVMDLDKSITAVFEKRQYPLSILIEGNGTIKEELLNIGTNALYPSGASVKLTALPTANHQFVGWFGDYKSNNNPFEIRIEKATNLIARFEEQGFLGYPVANNAKFLGKSYWENTPLPSDLIIAVFQKNFEVFPLPQGDAYCVWTQAICNGDFNNDGFMDVFNAGTAFNGQKANLRFLIWNPITKKFDEKNLLNNKANFIGAPTRVTPIYLNGDDYVDLVIHGHADEGRPNSNEPVSICVSDGKGGYDLHALDLEPAAQLAQLAHEHGDVGFLNADAYPDLVVVANTKTYLFWGQASFPYFSKENYVTWDTDFAFYTKIIDVNDDGFQDIIIGTNTKNEIRLNDGKGKFSQVKSIPYSTESTNSMNVFDYTIDDFNGDGRRDVLLLNATNHKEWSFEMYLKQADGSYLYDQSWIKYNINLTRGNYKNKIVYWDFNGDGKKDIFYSDTSIDPYTNPNNDLKKKSVFIREGNAFVERDFYQFDSFAKELKEKYYK